MSAFLMYSDSTDPHLNLARETALCEWICKNDIALYLWQNKHTVVIGRNQNAWKECRCELLRDEGGTLARRESGGGAVYHDLGNLNFTFATSPEIYNLEKQLNVVASALKTFGINAEFSGRNDLLVDGRKFSGNAFKHTKTYSMQHGTLLVCADFIKMSRYLMPSQAKLKAKGVDSVRSRVCNLSEFSDEISIENLKTALVIAFQNEYGNAELIDENDLKTADIYEKYSSWQWNMGETPSFDIDISNRFPWGEIQILMTLENGYVARVKVFTDAMDENLSCRIETALIGREYGAEIVKYVNFVPDLAKYMKENLPL